MEQMCYSNTRRSFIFQTHTHTHLCECKHPHNTHTHTRAQFIKTSAHATIRCTRLMSVSLVSCHCDRSRRSLLSPFVEATVGMGEKGDEGVKIYGPPWDKHLWRSRTAQKCALPARRIHHSWKSSSPATCVGHYALIVCDCMSPLSSERHPPLQCWMCRLQVCNI